jgi:hypothetical protein
VTAAVVQRELRSFLPHESVLVGTPAAYLVDSTETRIGCLGHGYDRSDDSGSTG